MNRLAGRLSAAGSQANRLRQVDRPGRVDLAGRRGCGGPVVVLIISVVAGKDVLAGLPLGPRQVMGTSTPEVSLQDRRPNSGSWTPFVDPGMKD